jgi:hypothetical protein
MPRRKAGLLIGGMMNKVIIYLRSGQTIEDTVDCEDDIDDMIAAMDHEDMVQGLAHTWVRGSDISAIVWLE